MNAARPFDGRVIAITGAGNGLGQAYAELLAGLGAKVVVNNRLRPDAGAVSSAQEAAQAIRAQGGEAVADHSDISTEAGAQALAQCALDTWGRIDGLICNAGFTRDKTFMKMAMDDFRAVMEVHLMGTVYCCPAPCCPRWWSRSSAASSAASRRPACTATSARPTMRRPRPA